MNNLYAANTLSRFWGLSPDVPQEVVWDAAREAAEFLPGGRPVFEAGGWDGLMAHVLGEGQFGPAHWQLSRLKRLYYHLRPFLPDQIRPFLRFLSRGRQQDASSLGWPIEDRYIRFLHAVLEVVQQRCPGVQHAPFWPSDARFAFVLTHDVESAVGQSYVRTLAAVDERYGFRSSFNFVPKGYPVDHALLAELRERGFEVGVHGLRHDGKLFSSRAEFERRAATINGYLQKWGAAGFRAPFTHRNPEWMQSLEIEYDLSFFDTDPYETIPGGTMSIWPFFCGRFVELPYTLVQDHALFESADQGAAQLWLDKVDFIARWGGMALLNAHPDHLRQPERLAVYEDFLRRMAERLRQPEPSAAPAFWHALPRDVARWWRQRADLSSDKGSNS
jgi:peptidoglycan/xylan/chitin deacetylase (PgdA/CDA1 family)